MWIKDEKEAYFAYLAGFLAAFYTAFSFTFWNNAIEAEVYSGLAFTINLIVWLTMIWVEKSEDLSHQNILLLMIYIFFMGFGIHQTSLQIAPAVLFIAVYPYLKVGIQTGSFWKRFFIYLTGLVFVYLIFIGIGKSIHIPDLSKYMFSIGVIVILIFHLKDKISPNAWWLALILILIALSTHIFLMVRSSYRPFINEGHPHTLKLFTDYVLRRQYGVTTMFVRRVDESGVLGYNLLQKLWYQFDHHFLRYFSWQFFNAETISTWLNAPRVFIQFISNIIVVFLGFGGAYYQFKKNKHSFAYFFSFMFLVSIGMVFVINLSDAEVRDRDYFFSTAYNFWTVWMAFGSIALIDFFRKKGKKFAYIAAAIVIVLPGINLASNYFIHDRSREYIALDYGQNILNSVEENAIIFTNGDNDTFPVWYAQAVFDPAAIEYIPPTETGRSKDIGSTISHQKIIQTETTRKILKKAMDFKNDQCKGIRKDITIANLSLLNTPWYIKQLRDHEGVEFNIPDKHIELCQENPSSVLYPRQVNRDTPLTIKGVDENDEFTIVFKKGTILYVKDLAVIQIIKDNYGKRPIYFAVTAPDAVGFEEHLRNEGMVDRLVAFKGKDQFNMKKLITNIDSVYSYRGIMDDTIYKDTNMKRLLNNYGAAFMRTSRYAHYQKDYDNAIKYMHKAIDFIDSKSRFYFGLSRLYMEAAFHNLEKDLVDKAFEYLENAVFYNRTNEDLLQVIFQATVYSEDYEKGISLLEKIKPYQDSIAVEVMIDRLEKMKS
jgi:hypothetical protein